MPQITSKRNLYENLNFLTRSISFYALVRGARRFVKKGAYP